MSNLQAPSYIASGFDVPQQAAGARSNSGASGIGALESLPQSLKDLQLSGDAHSRDGKEPVCGV